MDDAALIGSLAADVATMKEVARSRPEAAVLHCPGWDVADLVRHHGGVMRWAARVVETGHAAAEEPDGPPSGTGLVPWYEAAAAELIATLSNTDRDRDCWTLGRPAGKAWFWIRRQALEAAVHRWDAETAVGAPEGIGADLSADGIAEVAEELFPRQVALARTPALSATVALRATDLSRSWTLGDTDPATAGGELSGTAEALLLLLWRRIDLDDPALAFTGPDHLRDQLRGARPAP